MENFKEIKFEHVNDVEVLSISEVLGMIQEPFDQIGVATKTFNKHHDNPNSEYFGLSVEQICEKWSDKGKASCHYGSLLDNYIGYTLNKQQDEIELFELDYDRDGDERLSGICNSFDEFVNDYLNKHPELVFVTREQYLYHKLPSGKYIRGRFDALFYNTETNRYLIVDWKSSGDVEKKTSPWTKKLLGPAKDIDALNWNTYTMQVYFYKTALENNGYIPEGSGVDCVIIQLPGHVCPESQKTYCMHNPAFAYNKDLLERIFEYAHKKKALLNKNK